MLFLIVNIDKPGRNDVRLANRPAQHDYIEGFRDRILFARPHGHRGRVDVDGQHVRLRGGVV